MEEKQKLIEEILNIPHEELESITESMIETYGRTLAQLFTLPHILPMEELVGRLENSTFIDPIYTESWLRSFMDYVSKWADYEAYDKLKVEDEQSFITALRDVSRGAICGGASGW